MYIDDPIVGEFKEDKTVMILPNFLTLKHLIISCVITTGIILLLNSSIKRSLSNL